MQNTSGGKTRFRIFGRGLWHGLLGVGLLFTISRQAFPAMAPNVLTLRETVALAQKNDPWLVKNRHEQEAVQSMSVAAGTLPDPKMSVALANLPTDTFEFDQEPMTQLKVGITQIFPRGQSLQLQRQQLEIAGAQYPFQRDDRRAKLTVMVSNLWLAAYKAQESIVLIERNRPLFEQLTDIAEASYSSALGKTRQQDLIRAQLELTRLDDRLTTLRQQKETALKQLSQYLSASFHDRYLVDGPDPGAPLSWSDLRVTRRLPEVPMLKTSLYTSRVETDPEELYEYFSAHPAIRALDKKIEVNETGVELARQNYKPEWGVNASYAIRADAENGSDRPDFFSVGVTFDLPLFPENRQDKQVAAALSRTMSVQTGKWLIIRKMIADFEKLRAQLQRLNERQQLYRDQLLPRMHEQAEASLTAYTNDDGDFAEAVRARIAELDAQVSDLSITVDRQETIIQLNYYFMQNAEEIITGTRDAGDRR